MLPTIAFGSEKRFRRGPDDPVISVSGTFLSIYEAFKTMPRALLKVVLVFLLSWYDSDTSENIFNKSFILPLIA
jgi:hypothetical protein